MYCSEIVNGQKTGPRHSPCFPPQEWGARAIPEIVLDFFTKWLNVLLFCQSFVTRGVHLIVALWVCKAHYNNYLYFIHFNRLVCSSLIEIQFLVFETRFSIQISRL